MPWKPSYVGVLVIQHGAKYMELSSTTALGNRRGGEGMDKVCPQGVQKKVSSRDTFRQLMPCSDCLKFGDLQPSAQNQPK